jgi:uncharacterized protein involved in exopolysaccharide biosynthesis
MTEIGGSERWGLNLRVGLAALARRKWPCLFTMVLILGFGLGLALFLPPVYRSEATILIEEPDVPRDLVTSTVAGYADERLQVITQRVMTSVNLTGIIERFDLYAHKRGKEPIGLLVEKLRSALAFKMINAEIADRRARGSNSAAIAFAISFEHSDPLVAQQVANEVVTLFLSENLRARRDQAAHTTQFLTGEASRLQERLAELERQLAVFKQEHTGSLPEQMVVNLQAMTRAEQSLQDVRQQIRALQERRVYLQSQVAQLPQNLLPEEIQLSGSESERRLALLKADFARLSGVYSAAHPDLRRLTREIEGLEREAGVMPDRGVLEQETETTRAELAAARERLAQGHPEVVQLSAQLASLEQTLAAIPASVTTRPQANPAYVQIATQLNATAIEISALKQQESTLQAKLRDLEGLVMRGPEVERAYLELQRNYQNVVSSYQDVVAKRRAAELGEALESESKSETLSLLEPPNLPASPIKPPRLILALASIFLGVAGGGSMVWLLEVMDPTIRGARQVYEMVGRMPLVAVPVIRTRVDVWRGRTRATAWIVGVCLLLVGIAIWAQAYVAPLDVMWAAVQQRMTAFVTPNS